MLTDCGCFLQAVPSLSVTLQAGLLSLKKSLEKFVM